LLVIPASRLVARGAPVALLVLALGVMAAGTGAVWLARTPAVVTVQLPAPPPADASAADFAAFERLRVFTVTAAAVTAVTLPQQSSAACVNETAGVNLFRVEGAAGLTATGFGPFEEAAPLGPAFAVPLGTVYLRTAAGSATVRCAIVQGGATFTAGAIGGGGGGGTPLPPPGAAGNVLTSDGTDWDSQPLPAPLPPPGAAGNVLTSDGTDWASQPLPAPSVTLAGDVVGPAASNQVHTLTGTGLPANVTSTARLSVRGGQAVGDGLRFGTSSIDPTITGTFGDLRLKGNGASTGSYLTIGAGQWSVVSPFPATSNPYPLRAHRGRPSTDEPGISFEGFANYGLLVDDTTAPTATLRLQTLATGGQIDIRARELATMRSTNGNASVVASGSVLVEGGTVNVTGPGGVTVNTGVGPSVAFRAGTTTDHGTDFQSVAASQLAFRPLSYPRSVEAGLPSLALPTCSTSAHVGRTVVIWDQDPAKPSKKCDCVNDTTLGIGWASITWTGGVPAGAACP